MKVGHQHLDYLARAVLDRPVTILIDPGAKSLAWSDGLNIQVADSDDPELPLAVMVQAALMKAGSLDPSVASKLVGRPVLARRYLSVEAPRAVAALAHLMPRRLLQHRAMSRPISASAAESLAIAKGRQVLPDADPLVGGIRPGALLLNGPATSAANGGREAASSKEPQKTLEDDEASEESKILKLLSNNIGVPFLGSLLKNLLGMGTQSSAEASEATGFSEDMSDSATARRTRSGWAASHTQRSKRAQPVDLEHVSTVFRYPEWNAHAQVYRPDWTRVEEFVPSQAEETIDVGAAIAPPSREMRRQIARIGLGFDAHHHHQSGDEIVIDDLVRLIVDTRAGQAADLGIYRALQKTRRDLGVLLLLDTSSSVRDMTADGRTIQQQQIALAWQIAGALDGAGDRVAIYGFNSWGRARVHLMRVKGFDERHGPHTAERLRYLVPAGFTRIGAAVRHAGRVIREQSGMPYRLVVLITDGLSYDDGYEAEYGEADTRRALAELSDDHCACLCLSVGSDAGDAKLARVFGEASFLRAERAEQVPAQIGKMFKRALAGLFRR